jgi:hypothetical protein
MSQKFPDLETALKSPQPLSVLRDLIQDRLSQGQRLQDVQDELERLRARLVAEQRDADEDVVLEALDLLVGWCSPHMRI